jgi:DNA polymerase III delta subunit
MLYAFHGEPKQVIEKVEGMIASLLAKSPDAVVVRVDEQMAERGEVGSILFEQGLFKANYIVYINALSSEVLGEYALESLPLFKESAHVVILSLAAVKEKELKEIEGVAEKVQRCAEQAVPGEAKNETSGAGPRWLNGASRRDPFAITDALQKKDARALFVELEHARLSGERGEEVLGVLFWAAKTMLLAASSKTASGAGLKDYPYRKALAGVSAWGQAGAEGLVFFLATAQMESYRTGEDIFDLLERELCG